jgi:hypothetical protein
MKLTIHLQLESRSRKRGYIHTLPHRPSWLSAKLNRENLTLYVFMIHLTYLRLLKVKWKDDLRIRNDLKVIGRGLVQYTIPEFC